MLTPMVLQYLVGLCYLRHNRDAVDITIGDMVLDTAAGKKRDIDVTVTVQNEDGYLEAFKVAEVKKEGRPLDVGKVEQLCCKMADMPSITHKSIFSASGYTEGAIAKASKHSVDLYSLKLWNRPIEEDFPDFKGIKMPEDFFNMETNLLFWVNYQIYPVTLEYFTSSSLDKDIPIYTLHGKPHHLFSTLQQYQDKNLMRSTDILFSILQQYQETISMRSTEVLDRHKPSATIVSTFPYIPLEECSIGPTWPHTHTLDVKNDQVYLQDKNSKLLQIQSVVISGQLQFQKRKLEPQFFIFEKESDCTTFAGAAIADYGLDDGRMFAIVFPSQGRQIGIHPFQIAERHKNMISNMKIRGIERQ